jgi:hypothetical protein
VSKPYKRYPPDPPSHKGLWILAVTLGLVLFANLIHQTF